jgi:hypothetical protein
VRYQVTVTSPDGTFVCGATLNCADDASAERRFLELPLPAGDADLRAGRRLIARRAMERAPLKRIGA